MINRSERSADISQPKCVLYISSKRRISPLHCQSRFCIVRKFREFFMSTNRDILLLLLAFFGVVGCSNMERLYYRSGSNVAVVPLSYAPTALSSSSVNPPPYNIPELTAVEQPITKDPEPRPSIRDEIPAHVLKYFERKPEIAEGREKSPTSPAPAPPAQSASKLSADNRLLEFLEKDLNKAVEQPKERRRLQFSKQVIDDPKVRHFIKQYTTTGKGQFQTLLARSGKYMPMISKVLNDEGLPEELGYLALVESELLVNARSQFGAVGLWQFVPATGRQYGLRIDDWVDERRDPIKSTRAAASYLKELHSYYGRWFLVTAAYNAGPGIINKALQNSRANDFWDIKKKSQLREETRNFVPKFVAIALIANDPKKYGFEYIPYQEPLEFDEVEAEGLLKTDAIAEMSESDMVTIKELNPALLRNLTPPGENGYSIRVPVGKAQVFAKANDNLKGQESHSAKLLTHEVKRGETLVTIARLYGQAVKTLMQINGLTTQRLQIGQKIKVLLEGMRANLR